ncbi:hypothetical protein ACVWZ6_005958 [Bradyrhizobium sp. GM6.1]
MGMGVATMIVIMAVAMIIAMMAVMVVAAHLYRSLDAAKSGAIVGVSAAPSRRNST